MKTTIELPDDLLRRAKLQAATERTSLRSMVEQALEQLLEERASRAGGYRLPDRSIDGDGVRSGAGGWDEVRDLAYSGRGA